MQPITTIRRWQIDQLRNAINTVTYLVQTADPTDAITLRDGGDGWTILEVMSHLRDFEAVFVGRAQLTLAHDTPDLPFPDPDALAAENNYNAGDLRAVLDAWVRLRGEYISLLEGLAADQWERPANHPTRGNFTLNDQLCLTVWHDMNHLDQMAKILLAS